MNDELYVHSSGQAGPVLFCLHGLLGDGAEFDGMSALADRYRVDAWDAPGYGRSPEQTASHTLDWYAEQAARTIEARADGPVHVLGTGWGGMIAMVLAASRADLVRSVIIANSQLGADDTADPQGEFAGESGDRLPAGYAAAARSMLGADLAPRLRGLQLPALVIAGEDSSQAVRDSEEVSAAIADAVFVTMHQAGSRAHREQPATFATWVRSFLYIVDRVREATR